MTSRAATVLAPLLFAACGEGAVDEGAFDDGWDTVAQDVTCGPRMHVFPFQGPHNIGYDARSCGSGTCAYTCPDRNANSDWGGGHHGLDVFAPYRAPVVAVAAGTVVRVGVVSSTSGLRIRLRDDCGWEYYYGHLDQAVVAAGQRVSAGQVIGSNGRSGTAAVHLHFNVSPGGAYGSDVDPFGLLRGTSPTACLPAPPPPPPATSTRTGTRVATPVSLSTPARFNAIAPTRIADTRAAGGAIGAGQSRAFSSAGVLPPGATGALLNLAVTGPVAAGFATAWTASRPDTSTLNYAAGQTAANAVVVGAGTPTVSTSATAHFVVDATGYLSSSGAGFTPTTARRVLDTRATGALAPRQVHRVTMAGASVPSAATAVSVNVTAVGAGAAGFLTVFPCAGAVPGTSTVSFEATGARANGTWVGLGGGQLCLVSSVAAHAIVDVNGWFAPTGGAGFAAARPLRILDTRSGTGEWRGRLAGGQTIDLDLGALQGFPSDARGVVANVTAVQPGAAGFLSVWACDSGNPATSYANHDAGETVPSMVTAPLGASRRLCVTSRAATHLVVDLLGAWR